ncbi:MAG: ABC transporter substrate-binding protein, partial [Rhodospirillales bacterium]|nr:ABC transporter substrate-binding protein [Rhodospirillales bacterium]
VLSAIVRGQGEKGWFGWFKDDKIEALTSEFVTAPDQAARLKITNAIQQEAFEQVPTVPLGLFYIRSAYKANLKGMLQSPAPFFWNVQRA